MPTHTEIRSNIIALLRSKIGFGVEIFNQLSVGESETGEFVVYDQREPNKDLYEGEYYVHKDVKKAVDHFLRIREERQLGLDFEKPNPVKEMVEGLDKIAVINENNDTVKLDGEIPLELYEQLKKSLEKKKLS